jgi:hypothetical protein
VESVSKFSSGPGNVVGEIAKDQVDTTILSRATSAYFWIKSALSSSKSDVIRSLLQGDSGIPELYNILTQDY